MSELNELLLSTFGKEFWQYAVVNSEDVSFEQAVLDACHQNYCGRYGKSWTCPPGGGDPAVIQAKLKEYGSVFIFTTKTDIEDSFDIEGMSAAHKIHDGLTRRVHDFCSAYDCILLGAGSCTFCEKCTYPDAPCRFPDKAIRSVESVGINVMALSRKAGINYINGQNTVTYFSAVFFDRR